MAIEKLYIMDPLFLVEKPDEFAAIHRAFSYFSFTRWYRGTKGIRIGVLLA